ncbi:MAG: hypothetical protein WD227_09095 [Vicinamibacterales bacterium]
MAVRQVVRVCAALVVAVLMQAFAPAGARANVGSGACGEIRTAALPLTSGKGQAASRSGQIPGLGSVAASIDWDNRKQLTLAGKGFRVTRTHTPLTREVELTIAGSGDAPLVVRFGGVEGFSVTKGTQVVRGTADPLAIAFLISGPAVSAFRERIGNYERRLIAGGAPARVDDPHADGFLLAGAFLSSLAGDPTAVGRARDLITRRIRGKVRAVGFQFKDCVTDYELYLLDIDEQRTNCLEAANSRDSWYARAADRLGCEVEFMAQALAGEGQFISCTALGAIAG